ncbi:MAG: dipicolinate synthase subunit B [Oscillospiraceae bacterium]|nr:dipicolinate synthase subunit B [Oscillospiraceae bacterium]MDE5884941.1 dipicolinate synthase subunit B [Oscillospiraceae bacterium]
MKIYHNSEDLEGVRIGFVMTGSFCTFAQAFAQAEYLVSCGAELIPVMSWNASEISTRFGTAAEQCERLENIANRKIIRTIEDAEPIGPKNMTDVMLVEPCTSNTAAKLALSITDSPATMAVKSHLRGQKPVVLAIASNDSLAGSMKHLGLLFHTKYYYFVPIRQDDPEKKPSSLVADFSRTTDTIRSALQGKQLQPVLI